MNLAKKINHDRTEHFKTIFQQFPNGKGVEVGVFKGHFSKNIIDNWNGTLYMVDVWRPLDTESYNDISNHANHDTAYIDAMNSINGHEDRAIMIRAKSEIAADIFPDNSLDFVYIDANHAYQYVVQDINLWYPKVKPGGYICGHDYIDIQWDQDPNFAENGIDKHIYTSVYNGVFGVNPAVDQFCTKNNLEVTVTNEWFGSWFTQKP
jgi:Methyltransferase domain